jgi:hypothetical protein
MSTELFSHIDERLRTLELIAGTQHTPPVEVSRQDVKKLQAEIESLRAALASTQADVATRTAGLVKASTVSNTFDRYTRDQLVPLLGDSLAGERKARERHVRETLGAINAEVTATKNAAAAQAMHSADYLRARAAHFARG